MEFIPEDAVKLLLAVLLGGAIGAERESRDKAAGLRTLIFICLGATLFTMLSSRLAGGFDPGRIASYVVAGVGFLGAGAILRHEGRILGLTTASSIWLAAAIGMTIGGGYYLLAILVTFLALIVLTTFPNIEKWMQRRHVVRTYHIICPPAQGRHDALKRMIDDHGLQLLSDRLTKQRDKLVCEFTVVGRTDRHEALVAAAMTDASIEQFSY